jgi:hypothetical protein
MQIQHVESEQWLGTLINANDNLVTALMTFEQLDRSIDADSDSEDEAAEQAHAFRCMYLLVKILFNHNPDYRSGPRERESHWRGIRGLSRTSHQ